MKVKKKNLYLFSILIVTVLSVSSIMLFNYVNTPTDYSHNAKVLTGLGCLTTTLTIPEFEVQQKFSQEILGYHYIRCE